MKNLKEKFQKWTGQNSEKPTTKQQDLKSWLVHLDRATFYDDGFCFTLVCNDDQEGVVANACFGEFLDVDTSLGY